MSGKIFSMICLFIFLEIILPASIANNIDDSSIESGTLAVLVHANNTIYLAVDSNVTDSVTNKSQPNADEKIIDISPAGSCAIVGFLGKASDNLTITSNIKTWLTIHPANRILDSWMNMLQIAADTYNNQNYSPLQTPLNRKPNDIVSTLMCADINYGVPHVIIGHTVLHEDYKAYPYPSTSTDEPVFITMKGVITDSTLHKWVSGENDPTVKLSPEIIISMKNEMSQNKDVRDIISNSELTEKSNLYRSVVKHTLTESEIKKYLKSLYYIIEKYDPNHVGKPNNLRVITKYGRCSALIDDPVWPPCLTISNK